MEGGAREGEQGFGRYELMVYLGEDSRHGRRKAVETPRGRIIRVMCGRAMEELRHGPGFPRGKHGAVKKAPTTPPTSVHHLAPHTQPVLLHTFLPPAYQPGTVTRTTQTGAPTTPMPVSPCSQFPY